MIRNVSKSTLVWVKEYLDRRLRVVQLPCGPGRYPPVVLEVAERADALGQPVWSRVTVMDPQERGERGDPDAELGHTEQALYAMLENSLIVADRLQALIECTRDNARDTISNELECLHEILTGL